MTIDRGWICCFKGLRPTAFSTDPPASVAVVFIDGQLKLQCPEGINDFHEFFVALYKRMLDRYLAMEGVKTIILGFDDSTISPAAKAATQAKRRSKSEKLEWSTLQPLPSMIPANYSILLMNRAFKTRVVQYIIQQVGLFCKVRPDQRIIIDYMGAPYTAVGYGSGRLNTAFGPNGAPTEADHFEITKELAECDNKWTNYIGLGDMILDAVDSDYVIIALATMERLGKNAPRIFVKRLLLEPGNAALKVAAEAAGFEIKKKVPANKKPKIDIFTAAADCSGNKENVDPSTAPVVKKPRTYEYADCGMIGESMTAMLQKYTPDALKPQIIRILAHLIALCGCDFTRGVPYLSGNAALKNADILWPGLCAAASVDASTGVISMDSRLVAEGVVGVLWKEVQFKKLCGSSAMRNADFETLYKELSTNHSISQFRRDRLITPMDLHCLVRSSNWCTWYWSDSLTTPCSLTGGDYGFTRSRVGGPVEFDDKIPLPPKLANAAAGTTMQPPLTWLSPS